MCGAVIVWLCASAAALAQDAAGSMVRIPSARDGAQIPVFMHGTTGATATLVLLPGGAGGIGRVGASGWPDGGNFLIRSGPLFAAQGFNVAMVARPSDQTDMGYPFRISADHVSDLTLVLREVRRTWPGPVWLVGTSRGTVSATAAGIALRDAGLVDGIVLTSSIVRSSVTGNVPGLALQALRVPVLVVHHSLDACRFCLPSEVAAVERGLVNSPVHRLLWVDGGEGVTGDPCEAAHYHGFMGVEAKAIGLIADWIRHPVP
jgi:hypothetical protein